MLCNLHVVERETLEEPLIEALLLALRQTVDRLQSLDVLVPQPRPAPHLPEGVPHSTSCPWVAPGSPASCQQGGDRSVLIGVGISVIKSIVISSTHSAGGIIGTGTA